MAIVNVLAFDDFIEGTSGVWYSPAGLSATIGNAAFLAVHAVTTAVAGTSPTVTVEPEDSGDSQHWNPRGDIGITAKAITEGLSLVGRMSYFPLSNVRLKVTLGGTSPRCRLKVFVTGRPLGG